MADETVRWRLTAESELPKLLTDLDALIRKQNDLGDENSRAIRSMNANVESHAKQYNSLSNSITGVKNLLVTAFGIDQIKEAITKIFDLTATYQKYEAALSVSLGSQKKAAEALGMLQNYADKSNFELDELADTFSKFAGRNVVMGRESMEKLGDVANAMQKPFKDLGEAILDINNTERWTELGVKAKTAGDKVSLTFHGTTIECERTEQSVMMATAAFGTLNGIQGATEKQAATLAGRWSSLTDASAGLAREAGNGLLPVFEAVIETGISLAVGLKNSAQEGGLLNAMFSSIGDAGRVLWAMFTELITPIREIATRWFPQFFESGSGSNEMMKVLGVVINTVVMGPFYALITVLREGWQALQLFYNGLQGVQTGMKGVWAAITGDWDQMGVLFSQASGYFDKSKANFDKMGSIWDEMSQSVEKSNAKILNSHQVTAVSVADITTNLTKKQQEAVNAEEDRWAKIKGTLTEGTSQYANAYYEHEMNLLKAKDQYTGQTLAKEGDKNKKLKEAAFMSANEIAVLTKEIQEDSLKDQLALVDTKMKLEIERVNTHKVATIKTEEDAAAAIKAIVEKAEAEKEAIVNANRVKITAGQIEYSRQTVELETDLTLSVQATEVQRLLNTQTTEKEKQKAKLDTLEAIRKTNEEEQKVIEKTAEIETKSHNERLKSVLGFIGSLNSALGDFSNFAIKMVDDIDLISGKTVKTYENQVNNAKAYSDTIKIMYGEQSTQYADSSLKVAESKQNLAEAQANSSMASLNMAMMVADLMQKVASTINDMLVETNTAIIEAYDTLAGVMSDYYDTLIETNKNSLDEQLQDFKGTYAEREKIIDEHYAKQTEYAEAKELIEYQAAYTKLTLENDSKMKKDMMASASKQMGEIVANMYQQQALEEEYRIKKLQREIETAAEIRDKKIQAIEDELDAFTNAKEEEIKRLEDFTDTQADALKSQLDEAKATYDEQTSAVKAAYDEQLAAFKDQQDQEKAGIQATYEFKQDLLAQSKADENEAIEILDRLRNEALERYRQTQVTQLGLTRDRILATLTDEKERQDITNAYAQKIADVHAQVEEAKLDKTKGVALATKQIQAEAKDGAIALKEDEKEEIGALEQSYQDKFKTLADERDAKLEALKNDYIKRETDLKATIAKLQADTAAIIKGLEDEITAKKKDASTQKAGAERDYANFVLEANKQIMRSQIQMAIAQIRAEIAMLQGKRNIFNRGKIDAAVGDLEGSISQLEAILGQDTGGIVNVPDTWTNGAIGQFIQQRKADKTPFRDDNYDVVTEAYDASGNQMVLTYTDEDRRFTAYDKAGNQFTIRNATGYVAATGKSYFEGTPWVEGLGYPDGRDTVPAMVNKGERILPTALNEMLGGPALSNEKLVEGFRAFEKLKQKFGSVRIEEFGRLNFDLTGGRLGTSVDLKGLEKEVKNLTDVIRSKPELKINVDANRISVAEKSRNNQHIGYYENLYNR